MPWEIENRDGEYCVVKSDDGATVKCHESRKDAEAHMRALYANEPEAAKAQASRIVIASFPTVLAKQGTKDHRTLVGYAATWDAPIEDGGGFFPAERMYLRRGAFKDSLQRMRHKVRVLFNHGHDPQIGQKPLGKPTVIKEDAYGLYTETPLDQTSWNDDLIASLDSGALDSMSVTMQAQDFTFSDDGAEMYVTRADLFEFGPVTFPANPDATAQLLSLRTFEGVPSGQQGENPDAAAGPLGPPSLAAITWAMESRATLELERRLLEAQQARWEKLREG